MQPNVELLPMAARRQRAVVATPCIYEFPLETSSKRDRNCKHLEMGTAEQHSDARQVQQLPKRQTEQ
jgi:hypothetical protein